MHLHTHTRECPFLCVVCKKSLKDSGTLKSHQCTHQSSRCLHVVCVWEMFQLACNLEGTSTHSYWVWVRSLSPSIVVWSTIYAFTVGTSCLLVMCSYVWNLSHFHVAWNMYTFTVWGAAIYMWYVKKCEFEGASGNSWWWAPFCMSWMEGICHILCTMEVQLCSHFGYMSVLFGCV